jgi:glycerophosphoryl diester phosphodiesterase
MPTRMSAPWWRIAHRGASGSAPEHTRPAFERALALGVDMIELDVQCTRDGELVVIHDRDLDRTTSGHGPVRACELATLRVLDAGRWFAPRFAGERILTLAEVLELVGTRARLNVEIKAPAQDWERAAVRLLDDLRQAAALEKTVISCFDVWALACCRWLSPDARLGLLWQGPSLEGAWPAARTLRAWSIHPHWALASADMIATAHAVGLRVLAWTVNDVQVMRDLIARGVDGIISDFPERFAAVDTCVQP